MDIPTLIVGIWMIINVIRGKTSKNSNIGVISLIAIVLNSIYFLGTLQFQYLFLLFAFIYKIIILLIIMSSNMECKRTN